MSNLRYLLERAVSYARPTEDALDQTRRRIRTRERRRRATSGLVAFVLFGGAAAFLWTAFSGGDAVRPGGDNVTTAGVVVHPRVSATVPIAGVPGAVSAGFGSVWVAVPAQRVGDQSSIVRIDPSTNEVVQQVPIPGYPGGIAAGEGGVWVAEDHSVIKIDPGSGTVVARVSGPGGFVAITPGAVWAIASPNSVSRIDPAANEVVATIALGLGPSDAISAPLFAAGDAVWTISAGSDQPGLGGGELLRISPETNSVVARIPLRSGAGFLAAGGDTVWVADSYSSEGTLLARVDIRTNAAEAPIAVPEQVTPFTSSEGQLWLMENVDQATFSVIGLNLDSLVADASVSIKGTPAFEGGGIFDSATNAIWVLGTDSLTRIDLT